MENVLQYDRFRLRCDMIIKAPGAALCGDVCQYDEHSCLNRLNKYKLLMTTVSIALCNCVRAIVWARATLFLPLYNGRYIAVSFVIFA